MRRKKKCTPELLAVTLGFQAVLLATWEISARSGLFPGYVIGPIAIVEQGAGMVVHGEIFTHMGASLYRAYLGFLFGSTVGIVLGLLSGVSRTCQELFDTVQGFVHAIPKISLFPAMAVWLGFSDASRITIIALSCFFPSYLNALSGVLGTNPRFVWLSRNAEASRLRCFLQVIVPASMPRAVVGLRISLMVAFILMVATEVVGYSNGLGALVMTSYQEGEYTAMYAVILFIALAGWCSNFGLQKIVTAFFLRGQQPEAEGRQA